MNPTSLGPKPRAFILNFLKAQTQSYRLAIFYSLVIGTLSLGPTIFMLEVYDRVVNSRSSTTLLMLIILVVGSYVVMELLELVRHELLQGVALKLDRELRGRLFDIAFEANLKRMPGGSIQAFNDLKTIREFIPSGAVMAILDAPMAVVFLLIVFVLSPWLGGLALIGAMVQVWIAFQTEKKTMPVLTEANRGAIDAQNYANGVLRSPQVIEAMGMLSAVHQRWMAKQGKFLDLQAVASDTAGTNNATSKLIQVLQSSLLLGAACWLTLKGQMLGGGGMMIVASTLGGKVLTPLAQLVGQWRSVVNARDANQRLENLLGYFPITPTNMPLPAPQGVLSVEGVVAAAPGSNLAILKGLSFSVFPGECVMIIGPSASGKTTLARLIMGIWPASGGKVRLDGADVFTWNKEELGPYLGYLPQSVELFDGTIAENVSRFGDMDLNEVERVIAEVGLEEMIRALPEGLQTRVGEDGAVLSGGQRQRVALARAIYQKPKLIILDEPNSSLDEAGELALLSTLAKLKEQGSTVLVITHRTNILPQADKLLMLRDGQVAMFGARDEVLQAIQKAQMDAQKQSISPTNASRAPSISTPGANENSSSTPPSSKSPMTQTVAIQAPRPAPASAFKVSPPLASAKKDPQIQERQETQEIQDNLVKGDKK
jgi:ATP-binding cassette subfamily C exporter for protease/lipase